MCTRHCAENLFGSVRYSELAVRVGAVISNLSRWQTLLFGVRGVLQSSPVNVTLEPRTGIGYWHFT